MSNFGFKQNLCTAYAMFALVEDVKLNMECNEKYVGVFLDLAKAFDTVPHKNLLNVLENYGVRGTANKVFENYLSERQQFFRIRNEHSGPKTILTGVPQGTILGPLLFITYIHSLFEIQIDGTMISYADDTVLLFKDKNWDLVKRKAENGVSLVKDWLDFNRLSLNIRKTNYIAFTLNDINRPDFNKLKIPNTNLEIKENKLTKYLVITVDKKFWKILVIRQKD